MIQQLERRYGLPLYIKDNGIKFQTKPKETECGRFSFDGFFYELMEKEKASWIFYQSWEKSIHLLSMEERGQLLTNLINYHKGVEITNNTPMLEMFWNAIEFNLDRNVKRYTASVNNGKKGGAPKGNQNASKQPKINLNQPNNNLNDNGNGNDNGNDNDDDNENSNVNENFNGNNNKNVYKTRSWVDTFEKSVHSV